MYQPQQPVGTSGSVAGNPKNKLYDGVPELVTILSFLKLRDMSNCRLVSKSWKQLIDNESNFLKCFTVCIRNTEDLVQVLAVDVPWKSFSFEYQMKMDKLYRAWVKKFSKSIIDLHLYFSPQIKPRLRFMRNLLVRCTKLESLGFSGLSHDQMDLMALEIFNEGNIEINATMSRLITFKLGIDYRAIKFNPAFLRLKDILSKMTHLNNLFLDYPTCKSLTYFEAEICFLKSLLSHITTYPHVLRRIVLPIYPWIQWKHSDPVSISPELIALKKQFCLAASEMKIQVNEYFFELIEIFDQDSPMQLAQSISALTSGRMGWPGLTPVFSVLPIWILRECKNLKRICVQHRFMNLFLTMESMTKMDNLEELYFQIGWVNSVDCVVAFASILMKKFVNLTSLWVQKDGSSNLNEPYLNKGFRMFCINHQKITKLNISGSILAEDVNMGVIFDTLYQLRYLKLSDVSVSDEGICGVKMQFPHVYYLENIEKCLQALSSGTIYSWMSPPLYDASLRAVETPISNLTNLEELHLENVPNVSDVSMFFGIRHLSVSVLTIRKCRLVTNLGLRCLGSGKLITSLNDLRLKDMNNLTPGEMRFIYRNCKRLRKLNVTILFLLTFTFYRKDIRCMNLNQIKKHCNL